MTNEQFTFFIISSALIFYSSLLEFINLNNFSKKDIFKSTNLYNLDIIATRIYTLLVFTKYAKLYLYPYMWTMVIISVIGSFYYFQNGWMFNSLTIILFLSFYVQYKFMLIDIALRIETEELPFSYKTVYNELDKEQWAIHSNKVKLSEFTKKTLDTLKLTSDKYGDIELKEILNLKEEPIFSKFKNNDDLLFRDTNDNVYDVYSNKIVRESIGFSSKFASLNKEEDTSRRMLLSLVEAFVSSLVLYFSLTIRL